MLTLELRERDIINNYFRGGNMVNEIRKYQQFLEKEIKRGGGGEKLFRLHQEKILEFQHERLVHLIIMLFFVFFAIVFLGLTVLMAAVLTMKGNEVIFGLMFTADLILTGLSVGYVRHYYYLENLTQGLYKFSEKILEDKGK